MNFLKVWTFYHLIRIISEYFLKMQITGPGELQWEVECGIRILIVSDVGFLSPLEPKISVRNIISGCSFKNPLLKLFPKACSYFRVSISLPKQYTEGRSKKLLRLYTWREKEKVQWLIIPTQQVLTFHCAVKEETFLPPKWYFQECLLAVLLEN